LEKKTNTELERPLTQKGTGSDSVVEGVGLNLAEDLKNGALPALHWLGIE
jgi:hypothetical protein